MVIEQALRIYILAQSAITAYIGDRLYFVRAPQNAEKPYIVFFKVTGPRLHSHDGASGLANPRFQFSVFSDKYSVAKKICAALQAALDGYSGTMGGESGVSVGAVFYINETDIYEPDSKVFHIANDYEVWHQE